MFPPFHLHRQQLLQIARIIQDTDPGLFKKLDQLEATDCMFAYRMVIVMLRRELPLAEVMTLWEVQWAYHCSHPELSPMTSSLSSSVSQTVNIMMESAARATANSSSSGNNGNPTPDFITQYIAAVVRSQRSRIMSECSSNDDVLRLFNAVKIDFWLALAQARKQHKAYAQGMAVLQRL